MAAARNSPTKKLGGNPLRRIFSRSKKHELEPVDESSPLMDNGQYTSISGSDRSSSYDPEQGLQQESKKETAKQNWQVLRRHVLEGDFLLRTSMQQKEDVTVDPDNVQARAQEHKIQKKIDEIRSGTEFSLWHGLVMIFIYLAISVAFYNTVFEPDWTMLDSMYFAMVTVTTVGYGVEIPSTDAVRTIFLCSPSF